MSTAPILDAKTPKRRLMRQSGAPMTIEVRRNPGVVTAPATYRTSCSGTPGSVAR